jgi:serine/threonine protein kinase
MTSPSESTTPGKRLGRYEVLRSIGRGGMAEVFLARSAGPGGVAKLVCIKRILPAVALDPRSARRFAEEARATLALQHANIVPVFEFGRDGQELFLVMEWIDGCDLDRLLVHARALGRRLSPTIAAFLAAEIAKALAYAHDRQVDGAPAGLIHRDVTPRNILLSRAGEVRLTDFGIARALGTEGAAAGTPRYMAPEQAHGEPPATGDDLYALGLLYAEMLLGGPARAANTLAAAQEPVLLSTEALADIPPAAADIVSRLLAPGPEQRLRSARELQTALAHVLAAATIAGDPDPREELGRWVREISSAPGSEASGARAILTDDAATVGTMPASVTAVRRRPSPRRRGWALGGLGLAVALAGGVLGVKTWTTAAPEPARTSEVPVSRPPSSAAEQPSAAPAAPTTNPAPAVVASPAAPPPVVRADRRPQARRSAQLRILAPGSWVTVYLDGRKLGDDAGTFSIPAGRHELLVENPPLRFRRVETITVQEGDVVERSFRPGS